MFEELDFCPTAIGPLVLRRRHVLSLKLDVFEVILGEEHLMSSLFTTSEIALADLGIKVAGKRPLDVVIGGLGLGYTAQAALAYENVRSLTVVEFLEPVIKWHKDGILPMGKALTSDARCSLMHGDFFALAASPDGFAPNQPGSQFDAILIDIDHAPDWLLDERSAELYQPDGLHALQSHLRGSGIMGLWSDAVEDSDFTARLGTVFDCAWAEDIVFANPLQPGKKVHQTVYFAQKAG